MKLDPKLEKDLKSIALKYLEKCKEGWDVPHTLAAVYYIRKLIKGEGGNEKILVTTMYLHDIGYPQLVGKYGFKDMMEGKKVHQKIGAKEAEKILKKLKAYSDEEINEIIWLICNHDNLEIITKKSTGQLVKEADSLAAIDWERVTPTFNKEDCLKYLDYFKKVRVPWFKTKTGKKYLKQLLVKAEHYFDSD